MKTFYIDPKLIQVKEELGRVRKDMGDLKELSKSIETLGQIVPIVVNEKNELIDGARRVGASIILNREIFCVRRDNLDDREMKALELEANIRRKAFNAVEEMEGIKFLHEMKQHSNSKWKAEDTGKMLGLDKTAITRKIQLANAVEAFPELKKLKNEFEIQKAIKNIAKIQSRADAVKSYEESKEEKTLYDIRVEDALKACEEQLIESIDVLITDPPYGIKIDKSMEAMKQVGKFTYSDEYNEAAYLYYVLAKESFRFTKSTGHAFVFFAPELYEVVKSLFFLAGWKTNHRPIIWIKHSSGQTNQPTMWPAACYEMCMYFRKEESKLILEGKPDWIQFNPVPPEQKLHPSEKPVDLIRELLQRVALPGDKIFDPFMGSGAIVEASILEKLIPIASDIAPECYQMTMSRIAKLEEK